MPVGVPQGSLLGPLLFLIYVNDLPDCHLASDIILYGDDTVIYYSSKSVSDLEYHINADLLSVQRKTLQLHGTAMGSPVSVVVAEILMQR